MCRHDKKNIKEFVYLQKCMKCGMIKLNGFKRWIYPNTEEYVKIVNICENICTSLMEEYKRYSNDDELMLRNLAGVSFCRRYIKDFAEDLKRA